VRLIQVKTADGVPHVVDAAQVDVSGLLGALRDKPVIAHNAAYDLLTISKLAVAPTVGPV